MWGVPTLTVSVRAIQRRLNFHWNFQNDDRGVSFEHKIICTLGNHERAKRFIAISGTIRNIALLQKAQQEQTLLYCRRPNRNKETLIYCSLCSIFCVSTDMTQSSSFLISTCSTCVNEYKSSITFSPISLGWYLVIWLA